MQPLKYCIGPFIRIGREILCLPYAVFFCCLYARPNRTDTERHWYRHSPRSQNIPQLIGQELTKLVCMPQKVSKA